MIKFFRKIRYNLMETGKTSKYFKYAIGEIALVVIGILIAVQINQWNTAQTNKQQERFYLQKLKQNIQQDTFYLNIRKGDIRRTLLALDTIKMQMDSLELSEFSNPRLISSLFGTFRFSPQTSTFDNLTSTGKLDLLNNEALIDSLFVYYNNQNNYTKQRNESLETYTRTKIGPYLMAFDKIGINPANKPDKKPSDYGDDVFIRNSVDLKHLWLNGMLRDYESVYGLSKNILKLIDDSL